ncbi:unknown [Bacteroides sp. CAG:144]|nr:unknown [Bacteroides sp. CAG:144]
MIFERVDGVVGRTYYLYMVTTHHASGRIFGKSQFGVALIVNFPCGFGVENFIDTESRFQFEVSPVIQWVAHGVRNGFRPFFEFFPVGGIFARAVTFVYTVGTHGTPFVMVSAEPYFGQRFELVVVGYHLGYQMAVIVDNRHFGRVIVI